MLKKLFPAVRGYEWQSVGASLMIILEVVLEIMIPLYMRKLIKYNDAGVREYWIVNPIKETVMTYIFENEWEPSQYTFEDVIPVHIYPDLSIKIKDLL